MIVGFQGRKGSGKNAAARRLALMLDRAVEFRAFADPLKDTVCDTLGITRERLDELKNDEGARLWHEEGWITWRQLLQNLGTAARHRFGLELWVDKTLPADLVHAGDVIFVTDARQPAEVARIRALGGVIVRIDGDVGFDGHESELLPDAPDHVIDNTARDDGHLTLDLQLMRLGLTLRLPLALAPE